MSNEFDILYNELVVIVDELRPFYDIDKIKSFSVYGWTKGTNPVELENVFDIIKDNLIFYVDHIIPNEAHRIIYKIQSKLTQLDNCVNNPYHSPTSNKVYIQPTEVSITIMKVNKLVELNGEIVLVVESPTKALYTVHGTKLILFTPKRQSLANHVALDYVLIYRDMCFYNNVSKCIKICK